jgi:hypothetical protein
VNVLGRWRLPVAGGGYFRLAPYALTGWAIRHLNEGEGQPAIVYLHPWEIDAAQPRVRVGLVTRLRHSVNVDKTEGKLRRLLGDFAFAPAAEVLAQSGLLVTGDAR